jgi:LPXTG-motif cell wall-anchored protein
MLVPFPVPFRGLPLDPDDARDPDAFRLDLSAFGMAPVRVVFGREPGSHATAAHVDLLGQPWSLWHRPDTGASRTWVQALGVAAAVGALAWTRRRRRGARRPACRSIG